MCIVAERSTISATAELLFFVAKGLDEILMGESPSGAPNAREVGKIRGFQQILAVSRKRYKIERVTMKDADHPYCSYF